MIEQTRKTHNIGLLTNLYPRMFTAIAKRNIMPNIEWDAVVDSSVVGYQKPDKKIFEIAKQVAQVSSNEILTRYLPCVSLDILLQPDEWGEVFF